MDEKGPEILDIPVGLAETGTRRETDSMGAIDVPADRYWGAQTQRSLVHFSITEDHMPVPLYRAYGVVEKAAAMVNPTTMAACLRTPRPPPSSAGLRRGYQRPARRRISPCTSGRTSFGTESKMNLDEVITNRAIQLIGGCLGSKAPVHPVDVNGCQSSNDTFPRRCTSPRCTYRADLLRPSVEALQQAIEAKASSGGRSQDRPHASPGRRAADRRAGMVRVRAPARGEHHHRHRGPG